MGPGAQVALRLALVLAGIPALFAVDALQSPPQYLGYATWELGEAPGSTLEVDGGPYVVAYLDVLVYNATRDATLAGAFVCSHSPCGPLVWVRGDLSDEARMRGPWLLRGDPARFSVEDVTPPAARPAPGAPVPPSPVPPSHGPRGSYYDYVHFAIAEPFTYEPAFPHALRAGVLAVSPLVLLALAPHAIPLWRRGLILAGVAAGFGLAVAERHETWGILGYILLLGLLSVGCLLTLLGTALLRRRIQPEAVALLAFALSFFAAITAIQRYFPVEGGE